MTAALSPVLAALGWDDSREREFAPLRDAGLTPARVTRVDRSGCDASGDHESPIRSARTAVPGVCTGDWAAFDPASGALTQLLTRRTALRRASIARTSQAQVLAANVDTVVVAVPLTGRASTTRLERLLAVAWDSGARPVAVVTKADEAADAAALAQALADVADAAPGVEVVATSAATGTGLAGLESLLSGTVVLLGPSGAGKSSLGNALLGSDTLATGAIRTADGRGRHTTTSRELLMLPGGLVLIDTPGLRSIGLQDADEGIGQAFADVELLAEDCRFGDCSHTVEPGCGVLDAIATGALPQRRLDVYRRLLRESRWAATRADRRARAERTREVKLRTTWLRELHRERHWDRNGR